ncbi:hypothetical protein [Antarcticirhabdus aurantiaca]|uniref:Uncharacterized protein n=1 Tax=Antarcticirhabdus aurantiaca TaxID=2606717 RepID=A0ACD4NKW6_9HYPH|nr:hypothetical protein OXU80_22205 [Jeongeuplla avenae]
MDFAVIENGVVTNAVEATAAFAEAQGWIELTGGAGIGWGYKDGTFSPPVTSPTPATPLGPISDRQFFQALALAPYSIITPQEALDAVKTGEIPQVMQAVIDQLPADRQFAATMLIAGGTEFVRDNDLVSVFGASQGMNAGQIDDFWRFAQGL